MAVAGFPAGTAEEQPAREDEFPQGGSVRHAEWGHGLVMSTEHDLLEPDGSREG